MNRSPLDDHQLEELKKKYQIDEKIAAMYNISVYMVGKEFDPRFRRVILRYVPQDTEKPEGQNEKG
jgi:hypothetical protein